MIVDAFAKVLRLLFGNADQNLLEINCIHFARVVCGVNRSASCFGFSAVV